MSVKQLAHFKHILLKWKDSLLNEANRTVHHMQETASKHSDASDRAAQEEEFTLELNSRKREHKIIRKIEKMINRIDAEDYGFCDACGIEIGLQRLEARPTAEMCINCKSIQEAKERRLTL